MRWIGIAWALASTSLLGAPAHAGNQNLLVNSDFDSDRSGWFESGVHDSTRDFQGLQPASGSLRIDNTTSTPFTTLLARQCAPAIPGETYAISAYVLVESGQQNTGDVNVNVGWWEDADCTTPLFVNDTVFATQTGSWELVEAMGLVAPDEAFGVRVDLKVKKTEADGSFAANFDHVVFLPEPSASLVAAVSLLTLAWLRRLRV